MKIILVAAAALVDVDNRVLIAQRPAAKSMAGLWEFPGGKVEPGETPEAALRRELAEELSIDVCETCLAPFTFASHAYETFHLLMPLYLCRQWEGEIKPRELETWQPKATDPNRVSKFGLEPISPLERLDFDSLGRE